MKVHSTKQNVIQIKTKFYTNSFNILILLEEFDFEDKTKKVTQNDII